MEKQSVDLALTAGSRYLLRAMGHGPTPNDLQRLF